MAQSVLVLVVTAGCAWMEPFGHSASGHNLIVEVPPAQLTSRRSPHAQRSNQGAVTLWWMTSQRRQTNPAYGNSWARHHYMQVDIETMFTVYSWAYSGNVLLVSAAVGLEELGSYAWFTCMCAIRRVSFQTLILLSPQWCCRFYVCFFQENAQLCIAKVVTWFVNVDLIHFAVFVQEHG